MSYNAAFFGLFQNTFLLLKKEFGLEKALELFTILMHEGLKKGYGKDFIKGKPEEFQRVVGARDQIVGLRVVFPIVKADKIIYQFLDDPFPNLKGEVKASLLDQTYLDFKIKYILGDGWEYYTTKHLWSGDDYTEHVLVKK